MSKYFACAGGCGRQVLAKNQSTAYCPQCAQRLDDALPRIVSRTGRIHGRGKQKYKWVSGLSSEERQHVREGTAVVLLPDNNPNPMCAAYKRVTWSRRYGYGHCNCSALDERLVRGAA